MSFAYWIILLAALIPAFLLWHVWKRRGRNVVLPFDHGRQKSGAWIKAALNVAESLPPLLLLVVIAILAGPQRLSEPKTKRALTNIEFCVDISGSMTAPLGEGSRYDASMAAIDEFLDFRDGDAFGLTFFGNSVLHWVPLTTDKSAVQCSPPFMRPEIAPPWFGGTEIGNALLACKKRLVDREEGDRMIVLVSDGQSSDLSGGKDEEIAKALRDEGIVVYAIHVAGSEPPGQIVNITSITGGEVFNPGDTLALEGVFHRIDQMQEAKLEKVAAETMDNFVPFCIAALGLVGMCTLASVAMRYTPW
jgi:Ca-activated chloride channel family protein